MKLQHVLIILTAAFVMLISKANANADYGKEACDQYCSKHNPGNNPYKLNCFKADSDDGVKECLFYCVIACEEQCSTSSGKIFCGEKVEIKKKNSTSTSEIVKIVIAVLVLLFGCLLFGLGLAKMRRNPNQVGYESVGGAVEDPNNPGVMMTQQGQEPASSADTATVDGS